MVENNFTFDPNNKEQQKAFELVKNTNSSLFITGKAGTGKTTFIKRIQQEINKNFLVLAPTGIAALKVEGQTIHSVFRFPFGTITPDTILWGDYRKMPELYQRSIALMRNVDTIIVDEVSMVRCDLVDAMDRILRWVMTTNQPFGGKQVIFVGDLCQLPPVTRKYDLDILSRYYGGGTPFFYKAQVIRRMNLPKIEFSKVYRQTDIKFINLLNKMRTGETTNTDLELLNQHIGTPDDSDDFFITLATVNRKADAINSQKLAALDGEEYSYDGVVTGNFKIGDCPAPESLNLKVGAQVIICRNKCVKGCVNGTIAKVVALGDDHIKIILEDGREEFVEKTTWTKNEKVLNEENGKLEEREVGSFLQYPLKLAWAITIHKSQGMTFDRMHFDLSGGVFASGQTYVAISRMRSLDGLTLSSPIKPRDIKVNHEVSEFYKSLNDYNVIDTELVTGATIKHCLDTKDYNGAVRYCLQKTIDQTHQGDYRSAVLMAKMMFDVMLDDDCLLGLTNNEKVVNIATTTCSFLNAVICLYGNRFELAINYADKVLAHRMCIDALFVKARALYALGKYEEAYDVNFEIGMASSKTVEGEVKDQKQYLFEAKVNEKLGQSNVDLCKKLLKLCPVCFGAYAMMRREAIKNGRIIEESGRLYNAFNDASISDDDFIEQLAQADSRELAKFNKKVCRISDM